MPITVDTRSVPPPERFEYWRSAWLSASLGAYAPLGVTRDDDRPFHARATRWRIGPVEVFRIASRPVSIDHPAHHAVEEPGRLVLITLLHGEFEQIGERPEDRRQLHPGDLLVADAAATHRLVARTATDVLALALPRSAVAVDGPIIVGRSRLDTTSGQGWLLTQCLRSVARGLDNGAITEQDTDVGRSLLVLAGGVLTENARALTREEQAMQDVKAYIENNLGRHDLSPGTIAKATAISVRRLHALFAAEPMTVSRWIQHQRLQRCRAELADPRVLNDSISAIGARWGFINTSHFTTAFRKAFGSSPGAYRTAALAGKALDPI
jgi:AraC-like DNA-binding protein